MLALVFMTLVGCSGKDGSDSGSGDTAVTGDAAAGATAYASDCESCHGSDGKAGVDVSGTASSDLTVVVPDQTDTELHGIIANGYGAMPAVTQDETRIADLTAYLRQTFP